MKRACITLAVLLLGLMGSAFSAELSTQYQQNLVDRLNYLHGVGPRPALYDSVVSLPHCGTSVAFEAFINRNNFTGVYKELVSQAEARPVLPLDYVSPAKRFKIHYATEGDNAVYQPEVDIIGGGDGVPDYVNKMGQIADSIWDFEINHLGFPAPPKDGFYAEGDDSLYDIYITDVGSTYYGYTPEERVLDNNKQQATSFIVIDNNFDFYPYIDRPLDAVRVTVAHEFFHAIHFGMDCTEWEGTAKEPRLYWWEMSAVWMEEMAYSNVNDYYGYLPFYLSFPWIGLQDFSSHPLHPYGAMLFPLFLTQKFDTVIVLKIWEKCRDFGVGPQFLRAADSSISEISGGAYHLGDAFQEFAVWNLFTGSKASRAPAGYKYSEAEFYPTPGDSIFMAHREYPVYMWPDSMREKFTTPLPQNLGADYIDMEAVTLIPDSMSFVFFGEADSVYKIEWGVTTVAFPISGQTAEIKKCTLTPNKNLKAVWPTTDYGNIIAIPTIASTFNSSFPAIYKYSYYIADSSIEDLVPDTTLYTFHSPYPNPCSVDSVTFYTTFSANKLWLSPPGADIKVSIFDIAGEKLNDLSDSAKVGQTRTDVFWNLDNAAGKKVAPGVYLAICRLKISKTSQEIIKKYKLAVIK